MLNNRVKYFLVLSIMGSLSWLMGCTQSEKETKSEDSALLSRKGHYQVEALFQPDPPRAGWNALKVRLYNGDGVAVEEADIVVKPWMTSMNHGSKPATVTMVPGNGNLYTADSVRFTMPGPWDVFLLLSKDGETDTVTLSVEVQ